MLSDHNKLSKFVWGAAFFLVVAAFIVPNVDFSLQQDSPRANATPDPFTDSVREFEQTYENGQLDEVSEEDALRYAPYLQARALTDAGPMTSVQITEVVEVIEEYRPQIAEQPTEASREALRNHRNELILEELPRLDEQRAVEVLDGVRARYVEVYGVDPASGLEVE